MEKSKAKREEYVVRIGALLRGVLNKQKDKVKEVTYGCVPSSDYEAGEILAKKVIANKLV